MKNRNILIGTLTVLICTAGCRGTGQKENTATAQPNDSTIVLNRGQVNTLKMQFVTLQMMPIPEIVYADGYISVPPQNRASISPMITGYVTAINFLEGQKVHRGQSVIKLKSRDAIDLQENYLDMLNKYRYQENEYNRQKMLNENNVNARKIFLQSESDYLATKASLEAIRKKLILTGIRIDNLENGNIISELDITASISGYVTKQNVTIGQYVNPDEVLFEITDPGHLHAELNVFEKDVSRVRPGQPFKLRVTHVDSVMDGKLFMVNKKLDEEKRTLSVHGDFSWLEGIIPGMYARAEIYVNNRDGWVLPANAIYRGENRNLIFERILDGEKVILRPVTIRIGREFGDYSEIIPADASVISGENKEFAVNGLYYLTSLIPGN